MGKSSKTKAPRNSSSPYEKHAHGEWNKKVEELEPMLIQLLAECLKKLKEEGGKEKVALSQIGEDLRSRWEKATLSENDGVVTELLRSGKRRSITEFIKAHYGGLAGLIKKDSARFEMIGAGFVKLKASEGMDEDSVAKVQPGKLLADEEEEDTGLDIDGIEV
jgi:hypothetical protein